MAGLKQKISNKGFSKILPISGVSGPGVSLMFIFASFTLMIFSFLKPAALDDIRSNVTNIFAPALETVSLPVQNFAAFVRDVSGLAELQAENSRLKQENLQLKNWYHTALTLEAENQRLKDLLKAGDQDGRHFITARIFMDSGQRFVKSLLVSSGKNQGVAIGDAVLSAQGLIGRTIEVGDSYARVLLVNDINSRIPVLIERLNTHSILAGENSTMPALLHLPADLQLEGGERVITSGYGGMLPSGLPVGRIVLNEGRPVVDLYADMRKTTHVRIVKKPEDPYLKQK